MTQSDRDSKKSKNWRTLYAEASRRIAEGIWKPGELIPGEVELAVEFNCARATVNRALQELAKEGFLDRKRKAGTRVALHPVRKATLDISITRRDVEQRGHAYSHELLSRKQKLAPAKIRKIMGDTETKPLYLSTLHKADNQPFLYESRWVNIDSVPGILDVDLNQTNANEWLVENALFTTGEIIFSAENATMTDAKVLATKKGAALFIVERMTWNGPKIITMVRLAYAPKFKMRTNI